MRLSNYSFAASLLEKAVRLPLSLVINSLLVRQLAPTEFGILSANLAGIYLLTAALSLGIDGIIVAHFRDSEGMISRVVGQALLYRLRTSLAVALVATVVYLSNDGLFTIHMACGILVSCVFNPATIAEPISRSLNVVKERVLISLGTLALCSGARIVCLASGMGWPAFFWITVIELHLPDVAALILIRNARACIRQSLYALRSAAGGPMPLSLGIAGIQFLATIAVAMYMRADQLVLTTLCGAAANGQYSAATKLSDLAVLPFLILINMVAPRLYANTLTKDGGDARSLEERTGSAFSVILIAAATCSLLIAGSSKWLIALAYGSQYEGAAILLAIHVLSAPFIVLSIARNICLLKTQKVGLVFFFDMCTFAISISINVIFARSVGPIAGAAAYVAAQSAQHLIGFALFQDARKVYRGLLSGVISHLRYKKLLTTAVELIHV